MKDVLDIPRTAMEVFEMLPEGTLCEVIDNALYMSPSPTTRHQDILGDIFLELGNACKKYHYGKAYLSPCDVYLDNGGNVVQPDLLFVKAERNFIVEKRGIFGAPDLVIEILSNNKNFDQEIKFKLYQRNNIPEYFIIDPETKEVWHYVLEGGAYAFNDAITVGYLKITMLGLQINF